MPHANIWIRREHWDEWQSIENKSDWVNSKFEKPVSSLRSEAPKVKLCKVHFLPLTEHGKCLQKGCKYS